MDTVSAFDEFILGRSGLKVTNRFALAPMTTNSSNHDGTVSEAELNYLARRASNGYGIGITSCAYVHESGKAWQGIGASELRHRESLRLTAEALRSGGGHAFLQLYDAGRLADPRLVAPDVIRAPSAIASARPGALRPREMEERDICSVIEAFASAASLGREAGFKGVEIHGANHYLIHQFFSPRANQRGDRWGGSLERRMRFPLEVARAIRDTVGTTSAVGYRVNPFEAEPGGFTLDEAALLVAELSALGLDYIHISMDDYRSRSPMREDRDWTQGPVGSADGNPISILSKAVENRCAVIASGGIRTGNEAIEAMRAGADLVAVGRAALIDPDWLTKVRAGDEAVLKRELPSSREDIETELTIPQPMVAYLLSRPGWLPRETDAPQAVRAVPPAKER